jgi:hypothetical protein
MKAAVGKRGIWAIGLMLTWAGGVTAAETLSMNGAAAGVSQGAGTTPAPALADLAKLARAKVEDPVILAYIKNSGAVYSLGADEVVYLRDAGVSGPVLTELLNQNRTRRESAPGTTATGATTPNGGPATRNTRPTYVVVTPPQSSGSSAYVIPYQPAASPYWYYWYYYNYYPGYFPFYSSVYYNGNHYHHGGFHPGFSHRPGPQPWAHSSMHGGHPGFHGSSRGPMHGRH